MVTVNFGNVDDRTVEGGGMAPPGKYLCKVVGAKERERDDNTVSIGFGLKIIDGEFDGNLAGYDNLNFGSDKAQARAKFILRRLGFAVDVEQFTFDAVEMDERPVLVTTEEIYQCPEQGCGWNLKKGPNTADGQLWKCPKDTCGWQGPVSAVRINVRPKWNGYESVEGGAVATGPASSGTTAKDTKDIPF